MPMLGARGGGSARGFGFAGRVPSPPVNTAVPTISGTAAAGSTLTATTGTWTGDPTITFAYQWQRGTTNISGGTSSTYTAQFGDVGNTLRCVVTATNGVGSASANSANTSSVAAPTIGAAIGGGYYAGQISTTGNGVATHYLIVAPKSSGEDPSKQWKTANTSTSGTSSVIDGPTNSDNMNNASHPAAQFCKGLTIGGFSDWFMPARNELEVCYYNLKPTTANNSGLFGINTNAVPSRGSRYTSGTPAQTSATDFQTGNTQAFNANAYWSSTQPSSSNGFSLSFSNGFVGEFSKTTSYYVRAVRRVAV
jgi:hypothetical protein